MKNSIYSMQGVGKVYKFTLTQAFKNKAYRASFIVMVVMIMLLGPIMRLGASSGESVGDSITKIDEEDVNITDLFIINDSGVRFEKESMQLEKTGFKKINVSYPAEDNKKLEDVMPTLTATQVILYITDHQDANGLSAYKMNLITADKTDIKADLLDDLGSYIKSKFDDTRYVDAGVDKELFDIISQGFNEKKTYTDKEFTTAKNRKYTDLEVVSLGTTFAVILMMVLSMASSYIITSVMEEKVSKLVETLVISVKPLALVMGKIFAMMTYVGSIIVLGFLGSRLSNWIMDMIMGKADEKTQGINIDALFKVGTVNAIIVVATVLITFLIFAFMSGIAGGACSKTEDMQSATGTITMLIMIGYIVAMIVPQLDINALNHAIVYIPIVACFVAPVLYIIESITLIELIIFFVINIAITVAMFFICAKVYRKLILIDGSKVKFITILKMIFGRDGAAKKKEVA